MIHFLFGTLWSVLFWVAYFGLGIFAVTIILKIIAKETFAYLTKSSEAYYGNGTFDYTLIVITNLLFWPVFLTGILIYYSFVTAFRPLTRLFCNIITEVDKMLPIIKFEK